MLTVDSVPMLTTKLPEHTIVIITLSRILYEWTILKEGFLLSGYGINNGSSIFLITKLKGVG